MFIQRIELLMDKMQKKPSTCSIIDLSITFICWEITSESAIGKVWKPLWCYIRLLWCLGVGGMHKACGYSTGQTNGHFRICLPQKCQISRLDFDTVDYLCLESVLTKQECSSYTLLLCHQRSWETYRDRSCDRRRSRRLRRRRCRRRCPIFRLK